MLVLYSHFSTAWTRVTLGRRERERERRREQPRHRAAQVNGMLFFEEYLNFSDTQWVMFPVGCVFTVAVRRLFCKKLLLDIYPQGA